MPREANAGSQSPTPSAGSEGTDLRTIAKQVEGLLDDDGHFNPNPDRVSRGHPDYDETQDPRAGGKERDERGRFKATDDSAADDTGDDEIDDEIDDQVAGDEPDEDTDEGDTDEDLAASAGDEAQDDEADTGTIQTLAEFAEALDVPIDELKSSITHTFNAAGEEVTVTLAELEKGYQKDADYRRSTAKLAQDRQAAEFQYMQRHQAYEAQNHFLSSTLQAAESIVAAELNDPRLMELRESDPAEWTARRDEIGQRLAGLRNARSQAAQAYEQFVNNSKLQIRGMEEKALLEKMPDFGKQHRAMARDAMAEMGFAPHEISEVMDHRLILGVLELANLRKEVAELREQKKQAGDAVKRVKKDIPKLQKPGKQRRTNKGGLRRDNIAQLRQRAQKSGKVEDAAKVIEQFL